MKYFVKTCFLAQHICTRLPTAFTDLSISQKFLAEKRFIYHIYVSLSLYQVVTAVFSLWSGSKVM